MLSEQKKEIGQKIVQLLPCKVAEIMQSWEPNVLQSQNGDKETEI